MSGELTNEEIRERLLKLNYDCGPVTDTTRKVHLKKLESLKTESREERHELTDEELRSGLAAHGVSPAPITSANRHVYSARLRKLIESGRGPAEDLRARGACDECEPMEID